VFITPKSLPVSWLCCDIKTTDFLSDALGSVRQLVSASGAVTLTSAASTGVSTAYSFAGEPEKFHFSQSLDGAKSA